MAKMFYSVEETVQRLNCSQDDLKKFVAENKLREFRDGTKVMFKVDQVDRFAGGSGTDVTQSGSGLIDLAPGEPSPVMPAIGLSDSGTMPAIQQPSSAAPGKISIFDATEIKTADAGAQTQISRAISEDPLSADVVGSGSGLLDLTRERDETSLGAELLDEIYPGTKKATDGGGGSGSGIFENITTSAAMASSTTSMGNSIPVPSGGETIVTSTPIYVELSESPDPLAGAFGAMALATTLVLIVAFMAVVGMMQDAIPEWMKGLSAGGSNLIIAIAVMAVVTILFAAVGFFVGKSTARA